MKTVSSPHNPIIPPVPAHQWVLQKLALNQLPEGGDCSLSLDSQFGHSGFGFLVFVDMFLFFFEEFILHLLLGGREHMQWSAYRSVSLLPSCGFWGWNSAHRPPFSFFLNMPLGVWWYCGEMHDSLGRHCAILCLYQQCFTLQGMPLFQARPSAPHRCIGCSDQSLWMLLYMHVEMLRSWDGVISLDDLDKP